MFFIKTQPFAPRTLTLRSALACACVMMASPSQALATQDEVASPTCAIDKAMTSRHGSIVTPGHVFAQVEHYLSDLHTLRKAMGKPMTSEPLFKVTDAIPRHVLVIAQSLLEKTNLRASELDLDYISSHEHPGEKIHPKDVFCMVSHAHDQLQNICKDLGVDLNEFEHVVDKDKKPSDVISAILQCNRQLNLLMNEQMRPQEVYSQVTLGLSILRLLHGRDDKPIVDTVPLAANKRPSEVYKKLKEVDQAVHLLGKQYGVLTPTLEFHPELNPLITPSDVHDLALLIVRNLNDIYLTNHHEDTPLQLMYFPGPRFPSHVYQRVETLHLSVQELTALAGVEVDQTIGGEP